MTKTPNLPNGVRPTAGPGGAVNPPRTKQHQAGREVTAQGEQAASVLANSTSDCLAGVSAFLEQTAAQRDAAIEDVSDAIAALYDPVIFLNQSLLRASQKVGGGSAGKPISNPYGSFRAPAVLSLASSASLPSAG